MIQHHCTQFVQLHDDAESVVRTFSTLMTLFRKCHRGYNSSKFMNDAKISKLGMHYTVTLIFYSTDYLLIIAKDIDSFMKFYRDNFPWATVMPKMHIMEHHTIPWLKRFHVGAGLMGEQGAESIHALMSKLENNYQGIANDLARLNEIVRAHTLSTAPSLQALRPPIAKRKKKGDDSDSDSDDSSDGSDDGGE